MSDYAEMICGSMSKVKESLVKEFRRNREKMGMSPEQVDDVLKIRAEWLGVGEIEENPHLFAYGFWEQIEFGLFKKRPRDYFKVPHPRGEEIEDLIYGHTQMHPHILEDAINGFRRVSPQTRMMINLREHIWHMPYAKGNIEVEHINSISSNGYARMYIFFAIMQEMAKFDAS